MASRPLAGMLRWATMVFLLVATLPAKAVIEIEVTKDPREALISSNSVYIVVEY